MLPFRSRICGGEGKLEHDDVAAFFLELVLVLHVVLDQLSQGGKLLSSIQVVEVPCVLDLDVGDLSIPPEENNSHNQCRVEDMFPSVLKSVCVCVCVCVCVFVCTCVYVCVYVCVRTPISLQSALFDGCQSPQHLCSGLKFTVMMINLDHRLLAASNTFW